ncbi:hypothetical protein AAMO2058_000349300 [Amorphochlora amoebiformis]
MSAKGGLRPRVRIPALFLVNRAGFTAPGCRALLDKVLDPPPKATVRKASNVIHKRMAVNFWELRHDDASSLASVYSWNHRAVAHIRDMVGYVIISLDRRYATSLPYGETKLRRQSRLDIYKKYKGQRVLSLPKTESVVELR